MPSWRRRGVCRALTDHRFPACSPARRQPDLAAHTPTADALWTAAEPAQRWVWPIVPRLSSLVASQAGDPAPCRTPPPVAAASAPDRLVLDGRVGKANVVAHRGLIAGYREPAAPTQRRLVFVPLSRSDAPNGCAGAKTARSRSWPGSQPLARSSCCSPASRLHGDPAPHENSAATTKSFSRTW